jgi:hypothetical protein
VHPRALQPLAVDPTGLRLAGLTMLAAGAALPFAPDHVGLPCPLRTATGIPCPLCGMTTSVEAMVRFDLHGALAANPAGPVAVVVAVALLLLRPRAVRLPLAAVPVALLALWLFELHRFSIL